MDGRVGAAPISWGVCDTPGWGHRMDRERVLAEVRDLGFRAVEAGPEGWLPDDAGLTRRLLAGFKLTLAAAEVTAVLHRGDVRRLELARVEKRARWLAGAGGRVLTLVADADGHGFEPGSELTSHGWLQLLDGIASVMEICARRGLQVALRPRIGSVIERPRQVERLLVASEVSLCLDTGHLYLGGCDPVDIVLMAAARIRHVSLKDVDSWLGSMVAAGELDYVEAVRRGLFRPLGEGAVGIGDVLEALRAARYQGWYVLGQELALDAEPPLENGPALAVEKNLAAV